MDTEKTYDLITSRHSGLIAYIRTLGIDAPVKNHVTADDVRDKHVLDILPMRLAALCASYTEASLTIPPELRGVELTLDQVRELGPQMTRYEVTVRPLLRAASCALALVALVCSACTGAVGPAGADGESIQGPAGESITGPAGEPGIRVISRTVCTKETNWARRRGQEPKAKLLWMEYEIIRFTDGTVAANCEFVDATPVGKYSRIRGFGSATDWHFPGEPKAASALCEIGFKRGLEPSQWRFYRNPQGYVAWARSAFAEESELNTFHFDIDECVDTIRWENHK